MAYEEFGTCQDCGKRIDDYETLCGECEARRWGRIMARQLTHRLKRQSSPDIQISSKKERSIAAYYPKSNTIRFITGRMKFKDTPYAEDVIVKVLIHELTHWAQMFTLDDLELSSMCNCGVPYKSQLIERVADEVAGLLR